ncbi:MAG: DHH family phosphoesterase [Tissierellia bacterium]|nr:DHH family phosphoesterase [Tissierellia bacterium]
MNDKKTPTLRWDDAFWIIAFAFILSVVLFIFNKPLGAIGFAGVIYTIYYINALVNKKREAFVQKMESLETSFSDATRSSLFGMPFPMCILNEEGEILWYNTRFKKLVVYEDLLNKQVDKLIPAIDVPKILDKKMPEIIEATIGEQSFQFYYNIIDSYKQEEQNQILLYGVDNTQDAITARKYLNEALTVMAIQIDNFDEVYQSTEESSRPLLFAEIDKAINTFAMEYRGFARKYDTEKYLLIFQKADLMDMIQDKFPMVEQVREMQFGNRIPPTMSIGIGASIDTPLEIYKIARLAVDVALGRGGDQVVLNDGENLTYYGGKKKAIEKHNKVKSRVISQALTQLVEQADGVYIMGHKNPDMDSFGSCLGIYYFVKAQGRDAKIILEEIPPTIDSVYNMTVEHLPELPQDILKPAAAVEQANSSSLVIVMDNHRKHSTEAPELLDISDQVVLIDHHRRGADYIEDPTLIYLEPYASSASELVTELIHYSEHEFQLPKAVADALLAGITVDTKSFSIQTGVRTFEAASVLKRFGADSISVKKLFREPADTVKYRSHVVANSQIYRNTIAISRFEERLDNSVLIAAQAADSMLDIRGVKASFVSTYSGDKIHISGRSVGEMSVQIILEKMGGGGHQTSAGVQLKNMDMEFAEERLRAAIDEYLDEEEEKVESNSEK